MSEQNWCAFAPLQDIACPSHADLAGYSASLAFGCASLDRKHAVAGCTAGLTSVLALHPLDVVKTRLQGVAVCAARHGWGLHHAKCRLIIERPK